MNANTYFALAMLIISAIRFGIAYESPRVSNLPLWTDGGVIVWALAMLFARFVEVVA